MGSSAEEESTPDTTTTEHVVLVTVVSENYADPEFSLEKAASMMYPGGRRMRTVADHAKHQHALQAASKLLNKFVEVGVASGVPSANMKTITLVAPTATAIPKELVNFIDRTHPDVVILGSRGMGALRRSISGMVGLGSVSDYVVHHAGNVGVLIVKMEKERS